MSLPYSVDRLASIDLESFRIEEGLLAPPVVCASLAEYRAGAPSFGARLVAPGETRLEKARGVTSEARALLESGLTITGANLAFDFGVLATEDPTLLTLIFDAYAAGRVFDVLRAQELHAIACGNLGIDPRTWRPLNGRYNLDLVAALVLGEANATVCNTCHGTKQVPSPVTLNQIICPHCRGSGFTVAKAHDEWRERYAMLAELEVADWPDEARLYPLDDAVNPIRIAAAQIAGGGEGATPGPHENLEDLADQCETAWAMHLGAMWGLRVDSEAARELRGRVEKDFKTFVDRFDYFFKKPDKHGVRKENQPAVKRAVVAAYGGDAGPCQHCDDGKTLSLVSGNKVNCKECDGTGVELGSSVPRTDGGAVSKDRDTLTESGDPELVAYGENEPKKILETYLPWLEEGFDRPLTLRPNVLVSSGRTSYDGLIQLVSREYTSPRGPEKGVRECIRARGRWCGMDEDWGILSLDYAAIELCALAQTCLYVLGWSKMADVLRATRDPGMLHTSFGASMVGMALSEMVAALTGGDKVAKNYRWAAKACNFGLPGGMGAAKFVLQQRKKNAGSTPSPDYRVDELGRVVSGVKYPGLRFCILLGHAERCSLEKVTEWRGRPVPALCRSCVEIVDRELRPAWFKEWEEIKPYHKWVSNTVDNGGSFPSFAPGLDGVGFTRMRGGLDFTNGANNGFQPPAADGAKAAFRAIASECYTGRRLAYPGVYDPQEGRWVERRQGDPALSPWTHRPARPQVVEGPPAWSRAWTEGPSPLLGARPIFSVHDEFDLEVLLRKADRASARAVEIMEESMSWYIPDIPIRVEPALMIWWSKNAGEKRACRFCRHAHDAGGAKKCVNACCHDFQRGVLVPWDAPQAGLEAMAA